MYRKQKITYAENAAAQAFNGVKGTCNRSWQTVRDHCANGARDDKEAFGDSNMAKICCGSRTVNGSNVDENKAVIDTAYNAAYGSCPSKRVGGYTTTVSQQQNEANRALESARNDLNMSMSTLRSECKKLANDEDDDEGKLSKGAAAGIGAAVGAVAGGVLGYTITDSIQKAALDQAEQAAIKEFMENVGSKIQCYIGGDEVGSYGEVISTSME